MHQRFLVVLAQMKSGLIGTIGSTTEGDFASVSLNDANETALRTFRYDEVEKISFRLTTSGISLPVHFQENLRLETSDSHLRVYGLDSETPTPVEVYDAAGRRVAQASLTSGGQLNIAAFTAGAYILKAAGQTLKFKVQ